MNWSDYQNRDSVNRRASGRRRINAERKARAQKRREEIKELIGDGFLLLGNFSRGLEARLAAHFGVHRSTICRDKEALIAEWRKDHLCTQCGTLFFCSLKGVARLAKKGLYDGCDSPRCALLEWRKG